MAGEEVLEIDVPFDAHVHLRSGAMLRAVLPHTASQFWGAVVMPNRPWVAGAGEMLLYAGDIRRAISIRLESEFQPFMTIALDDGDDPTTPTQILQARDAGAVAGKLYPVRRDGGTAAAATTGPEDGKVRGVAEPLGARMREVYRAMTECGMVLCIHAEMPPPMSRLTREEDYIPTLDLIRLKNPNLRMVVEHISHEDTACWVAQAGGLTAATITAHHLADTIDDALASPHHLCNPIPKREDDRQMLWSWIENDCGRFFFGSDSAPHPDHAKHCARPAAGCFTAPSLVPRLAAMFEERRILGKLEGFASRFGPAFYGLERPDRKIKLVRRTHIVPDSVWLDRHADQDRERVVAWRGGVEIPWSLS